MEPDAIDWPAVLDGAAWFHTTGITPALGAKCAESTSRRCRPRRQRASASAWISTTGRNCGRRSRPRRNGAADEHVDLVIANEEDLQSVLGVHVPGTDVTSGQLNFDGFRTAAEQVTRDFGPPHRRRHAARELSASDNGWSALSGTRHGTMHRASATTCGSSIASAAATASPPASSTDYVDRPPARRAAVRRGGQRAQADDPRRLQPRLGRGSRQARLWRCIRESAEIAGAGRRPVVYFACEKRTRTPPLTSRGVPTVVGNVPTSYSPVGQVLDTREYLQVTRQAAGRAQRQHREVWQHP